MEIFFFSPAKVNYWKKRTQLENNGLQGLGFNIKQTILLNKIFKMDFFFFSIKRRRCIMNALSCEILS